MILFINTKEQNRVEVTLKKDGKIIKTLSAKNKFGSQVLLSLIVKPASLLEIIIIKVATLLKIQNCSF